MRIAVIMYGASRASSLCLGSLVSKIISPASLVGSVQIFGSLNAPKFFDNGRSGEYSVVADDTKIGSASYIKSFDNLSEDFLSIIDIVKRYPDFYNDGYKSIGNLLFQLKSLSLGYQSAGEDFDVYVFVRPDLLYHDPMTKASVRDCARDRSLFVTPGWQKWGGFNDRFAVCGARAARVFANRVNVILPFVEEFGLLHSERLLKFAVDQSKLNVRHARLRASRVRSNGLVWEESFRLYDSSSFLSFMSHVSKVLSLRIY